MPQTRWLKQDFFFPYSSGGQGPRSRCSGWFWARLLFLVCRWPPLAVCSHGFPSVLAQRQRKRSLLSFSPLRIPALWDYNSTLVASFNLNCLPKGPIFKYSHIGRLGLQHTHFGDGYNSIHDRNCSLLHCLQ